MFCVDSHATPEIELRQFASSSFMPNLELVHEQLIIHSDMIDASQHREEGPPTPSQWTLTMISTFT